MTATTMQESNRRMAGYTSAEMVFRRTLDTTLTYATYRRMTCSRFPLFSPAISEAVYTPGKRPPCASNASDSELPPLTRS